MLSIKNTLSFTIDQPCVVSLGKFDGLHSGHKLLVDEMMKGKKEGLTTVAITFSAPPVAYLSDHYQVISTNEEKEEIFDRAGIDVLIELPFTKELKEMSPRDFLSFLTKCLCVKRIVVGKDFRFGKDRAGDVDTLFSGQEEFGYRCTVVDKLQYGGEDISSTRIRDLIRRGKMEEANELLGYPYFIRGTVIHGAGLGHTVGIPTINFAPKPEKLLPPFGVYSVIAKVRGKAVTGVCNVGRKPTVGEYPVGVETYLMDFSEDIYGETLDIEFYHFMRPEEKFSDFSALMEQMKKDIEEGKRILSPIMKKPS